MTGGFADFLQPGDFVLGDERPEDLADCQFRRVAAELLHGHHEQERWITLKRFGECWDPVQGKLAGADLDHCQHIGLGEACLSCDQGLGLSGPEFKDPLLEELGQARVGEWLSCILHCQSTSLVCSDNQLLAVSYIERGMGIFAATRRNERSFGQPWPEDPAARDRAEPLRKSRSHAVIRYFFCSQWTGVNYHHNNYHMQEPPLSRVKLSDQVVDRIKFWLMSRNMQPGDRLPSEKELIGILGVSRGTMREALKALEVQGLINIAPGRSGGAVVAEVRYETAAGLLSNYFYFQRLSAAEIYDMRQRIEPEMAVSVVDQLDETDFARLKELIVACHGVADTPEARRQQRLDELEFHNVLAMRSPNRFFNKVLADQVVFKRMYEGRQTRIDNENHAAHSELLAAYLARDPDRVRTAMTRHMRECACHISELEAEVQSSFFSDPPFVGGSLGARK